MALVMGTPGGGFPPLDKLVWIIIPHHDLLRVVGCIDSEDPWSVRDQNTLTLVHVVDLLGYEHIGCTGIGIHFVMDQCPDLGPQLLFLANFDITESLVDYLFDILNRFMLQEYITVPVTAHLVLECAFLPPAQFHADKTAEPCGGAIHTEIPPILEYLVMLRSVEMMSIRRIDFFCLDGEFAERIIGEVGINN